MTQFRIRRGKVVEVPAEWQGVVTYKQTRRKRPSNLTRQLRNDDIRRMIRGVYWNPRDRIEALAPKADEWIDD